MHKTTPKHIHKCLFPVAGYGTRFLPATKAVPKEMLPVLTKPLIQYGVEEALGAGCSVMAMVTSKYKKTIEDHFDTHTDIAQSIAGSSKAALLEPLNALIGETTFCYTRQLEMKGLGHAILTGEPLIGDEPFAVILPDDLCWHEGEGVLAQMTALYRSYPGHCIVAVEEVPESEVNKYGIVAGTPLQEDEALLRLTDMVEKPDPQDAPSNLAIIGRYILIPEIFGKIAQTPPGKGGEIQITDALLQLAKEGRVLAYRFKGRRFDCGSVDGFVEATNFFYAALGKENR
jgi:UTP--glucose-1-phosphate uridylyltransferase